MLGDEYLSFWAKNAGNTGVRHKQTLELRNIEYEQNLLRSTEVRAHFKVFVVQQ